MIAAQRLDAGARRLDQVLDDRGRDVVAVQRRLERALVAARARLEPVALADAVVERRVGVEVGLVGLVQRARTPSARSACSRRVARIARYWPYETVTSSPFESVIVRELARRRSTAPQ